MKRLAAIRVSPAEFARRVKVDRSTIHGVLSERPQTNAKTTAKIPVTKAAEWADGLELKGAARWRFLERVLSECGPPIGGALVRRYRTQMAEITEAIEDIAEALGGDSEQALVDVANRIAALKHRLSLLESTDVDGPQIDDAAEIV